MARAKSMIHAHTQIYCVIHVQKHNYLILVLNLRGTQISLIK